MASEREEIRKWIRENPVVAAMLHRRIEEGKLQALKPGDRVDVIVCGRWPSSIDGSAKVLCSDCGAEGSLSPSGQEVVVSHNIQDIVCLSCASKRAESSGA